MSKSNKAKPVTASKAFKTLLASAASVGFNAAGAFETAVDLFAKAVKLMPKGVSPLKYQPMVDLGNSYQAGHIARRLLSVPGYAKRWGNMDEVQKIEAAAAILAAPAFKPGEVTPGMRTELEHKACRAASKSLTLIRERAGIISERKGAGGRAPRTSTTETTPPPVDLVKAAPKFDSAYQKAHGFDSAKAAANDYFATAAAALMVCQKKNARNIPPAVSSALEDFHAALVKAGLIKSGK